MKTQKPGDANRKENRREDEAKKEKPSSEKVQQPRKRKEKGTPGTDEWPSVTWP